MEVYIVFRHSNADYPNVNTIECICLTEDLANRSIEELEKAQATFSRKAEYWWENFEVIKNL